MTLTTTQLQTLRAAILSSSDLNSYPSNSDGAFEIARLLNLTSSPVVMVWKTDTKVSDILDAINWPSYTPTDVPDLTTAYTNRLLAVQTKQMNLQNMLIGRETIDTSKANIRSGLRDAVIQLPTGPSGSLVTAAGVGGSNVLNACTRQARRVEVILAGAPATTGSVTAKLLEFEGEINYQDVIEALKA